MNDVIDIAKIVIDDRFIKTKPKDWKLNRVRKYYNKYNCLDKPIVLNKSLVLIDGYIRYLVAKENGMAEIPFVYVLDKGIILKNPMPFITGRFDGNDKVYVWKNDRHIPIEAGDKVKVNSWNYKTRKVEQRIVTVVNVFESDIASMLHHKSVIAKIG